MKAALLGAAALLLPGCATLGERPLGWLCSAEANSAAIRAASNRALDERGTLREGQTEYIWSVPGAQAQVMARWDVGDSVPETATGRFRFRMSRSGIPGVTPGESAQLRLMGGDKPFVGEASPFLAELYLRGSEVARLLQAGHPLLLQLVARTGAILAVTPLDRAGLDEALNLARKANAESLARSADYPRLCEREQRIILT